MIDPLKRRTKVIWSIDGRRIDAFDFDTLTDRGLGALRITYYVDLHHKIVQFLQELKEHRSRLALEVPIMLDVAAIPQAVVTQPTEPLEVEYGRELTLSQQSSADITIETGNWDKLFTENESAYVGYGSAVLRVKEIGSEKVTAKVIHGGVVNPGACVHVPSSRRNASLKDLADIDVESFRDLDIDYVILPGIGRKDITLAKRAMAAARRPPWLIIKIDAKSVYDQLDEILEVADGVMICRRELALSSNPAIVPIISKDVIQKTFEQGRIVIMASEILASMAVNPTPTRAEVSDIANAVIDGSDAVVLSEELASGRYTAKAQDTCLHIIEDLERDALMSVNWQRTTVSRQNELDVVAFHAYRTATRLKAKAIVCITKAGVTALRLASFRLPIPIIAVTFSQEVRRRLSLVWGVSSIVLDLDPGLDQVLPAVSDLLKRDSWLHSGDIIVFVTVSLSSVGREASNLFTVQRLD